MRTRGGGLRATALSVALLGASLAPQARPPEAGADPGRPNVLLIISDDQAWSTFSPGLMPSVYAGLVDEGVLFTRAYVNSSLCCPSRSEILTGLYEHHTGVDANTVPFARPTIVQALHDAGYRTAMAGKYLNSMPCDPLPEFDEWMCSGHKPSSYSLRDPFMNVNGTWRQFRGYTAQIQANFLGDFIRGTPAGQPFFAMYTPTSPHLPADDDRYASLPVSPLRGASYDQETRTKSEPVFMRRPPLEPTLVAEIDEDHAAMTRAVRALDDSVETILSSLGTRERDTIVFYLSDNGFLYGEHRWVTKRAPYEESVRVPFVVRYPALRPENRAAVSEALVENVDIAPTVAELAALPWGADGRSLVPIVGGLSGGVREAALLETCRGVTGSRDACAGFYHARAPQVPAFWGMVTERYKYVEYATGERELYDLSTDPAELANLAGVGPFAGIRRGLSRELAALRAPPEVDTTIVTGPSASPAGRVAAFTFFSQSRFATFQCRLDRDGVLGTWHACNGGAELVGSLGDGSYTFQVAGTDERGLTDPTPATRTFAIRSTGPDVEIVAAPPPHLTASSVSFSFSSGTAGAMFECRLTPLEGIAPSWTSCNPATGQRYGSLGQGWWSFEVRATDPATAAVSDPPAEALFLVDRTGPRMTFARNPLSVTAAVSARFSFAADEATSGSILCRLDRLPPADCSGGRFRARDLQPGEHRLRVAATDELGNGAATTFEWLVDRTAPTAHFRVGPSPYSSEATAGFRMRFPETILGFTCRLDGGPLMMCPRAPSFGGLADGVHAFTVTAFDQAFNASPPVTWSWVQDTHVPAVTMSGGPSELTSSTSATFSLTGSEPGTFECSLDGAPFAECASPVTVSGLADGPHSFAAREQDLAGNLSEPATTAWTVDTRPANTSIGSGPSDPSADRFAVFTFAADEPDATFWCSLDGGSAQSCASGVILSGLAAGPHVFAVHAVDAAGNTGPDAIWSWTIV